MQLKLQRSQRMGGVTGGTVFFCLDVRADYTAEEQENIRKYRLGSELIYNSQAARKYIDKAGVQLDRTQSGGTGERMAGLARGAFSMAMAKMQLNISIASLGKGHHIECKDLGELLDAEETVRTACKNVTRYLETAATFDGSEVVVDYAGGEETVHITHSAPPLLTGPTTEAVTSNTSDIRGNDSSPAYEAGRHLSELWTKPAFRKVVYYGGGLVFALLFVRSCAG